MKAGWYCFENPNLCIKLQQDQNKKRHYFLAWFKNWHLSCRNPTIKCLLTTTTYCCLEAQLTMTNYYKYHYWVSASQKTTSRYKAYWFLGKWALNYYYLIYLADLINSGTTSADICCQLVGLLLLSIATYFLPTARLHFFTALLYLHVHSICTSVDVVDPFMEHQVKTNKQILNFPLP